MDKTVVLETVSLGQCFPTFWFAEPFLSIEAPLAGLLGIKIHQGIVTIGGTPGFSSGQPRVSGTPVGNQCVRRVYDAFGRM